ncbi:MAG: chromosome segregation protein SMC, partial [Muribaculaceae bacterium]|nr:chromosome segregation protein SMC [Muribaculaceae bacterium]
MYLKSIEVHGFKSFANKIVFDFHNGITGIVGPNGSGKSNVADAVRWVLGEQSVKQLRGASMQDVIFAGTENRKPLSYAYVAITLDNADHQLDIDYGEVTVARRLYRSGESEYLINGSPCRLKEVAELFYDTGIGKEGYSIIGQGQIDRILSGKPEERRELFDEAAGIVKFKKRKVTAQKKLDSERENLVRVSDILAELERQVGPLAQQSEKAKTYLKKKSELKDYDVNMFLLESDRIGKDTKEQEEKYRLAEAELGETSAAYEKIKAEYGEREKAIAEMDVSIENIREELGATSVMREKLESQIRILTEQIHTAEMSDEHMKSRLAAIALEKEQRLAARSAYDEKKAREDAALADLTGKESAARDELTAIQDQIAHCNEELEQGRRELLELLNNKAQTQSGQQRCDTMLEQMNIRKAELSKRLLDRKTQEADLVAALEACEKELEEVNGRIEKLQDVERELEAREKEWRYKGHENSRLLEEEQADYLKQHSRLESLKNIAERYDGYGNSIRRIMEQKAKYPGILGVVSDLIQVEKKYETAIETALSGNIQNIVTEDEDTAKKMIAFLKENRLGRATFLPLTSVTARANPKNEAALGDVGVIGMANRLVKCDSRYEEVVAYLLGRVLLVDTVDHAIALARKHHYSLHIVTLEGEYLSPGGSMTGGAFKNSANLLARNRQIEELEKKLAGLKAGLEERRERKEEIATAIELASDELAGVKEELQQQYILQNTAQMNVDRARQQHDESGEVFSGLMEESARMESQIEEIRSNKKKIQEEIAYTKEREAAIGGEAKHYREVIAQQSELAGTVSEKVSRMAIDLANLKQSAAFTQENIDRINGEIEKFDAESVEVQENAKHSKEDIQRKQADIEEIKKTILASADSRLRLEEELKQKQEEKERMSAEHKGFFQRQEEIAKRQGELDKELFRLNNQREKLQESAEQLTNYLWEEYELTPHAARELKNAAYGDLAALKKMIAEIKDEIRKLGDVNVNAIEDYKEISQRYSSMKSQHDDLVEAEQTLIHLIEELDEGMRTQFTEKFADIQREFDASFRQLFGGGHGTLELVEDEDILECGIRIIAQPPGKKLQNMMQLSGGEKALTAIALLFAIQALKPSPFCLLDEIEAALDDSNVTRFASYLKKLTMNTQ